MPNYKSHPDLSGEASWEPISPPGILTNPNSFISGDPESNRLRLKYYHDPEENRIVAQTWFGPGAEGPPRHAHGGSIAAVLDEAMGMAALFAGHPVVARSIHVNFYKILPLETVVSVITRVKKVERKKVFVTGELISEDNLVFASSDGLFIDIGYNALAEMMKG